MPEPETISVAGHGRAEGAPDVWRVHLTATALGPAVTAALAESDAAARRVREALLTHGVAPADASTGTVTVRAEEDWSGGRGPRLLGYRAEHTLRIVLRDLTAAGRALGEAIAAGGEAVRLQSVEAAVEDDVELRAAALAAAWRDAVRTAAQLADLAGRTLGDVRSIQQGDAPSGRVPLRATLMSAAAASGPPEVGLEPGSVGVEVSLAVVWELG